MTSQFQKFKTNYYHSFEDLKDNPLFVTYTSDNPPSTPISLSYKNPYKNEYYGLKDVTNTLVIGGSNAYKTSGSIIPQIEEFIRQGMSYVSFGDQDIQAKTKPKATKAGYKVLTLDLLHPERSNRYNPFVRIERLYNSDQIEDRHIAIEMTKSILHTIFGNKVTKDEFWNQDSEKLALCAAFVNFLFANNDQQNLPSIMKLGKDGLSGKSVSSLPFTKIYEKYKDEYPELQKLGSLINEATDTRNSTLAVYSADADAFLDDPLIEYVLTDQEFPDFIDLMNEKYAIYVILPFHNKIYMNIVKVLLLDILQQITNEYTEINNPNARRLLISCDEFASYAFNEVESYISNSRKYNIQWTIALQSPSQLSKLGTDFQTILSDNCMNKVYLAMNNLKVVREISESYGTHTIYYKTTKLTKPIIPTKDLLNMPKKGALIECKGQMIFDYLTPYFEMPGYEEPQVLETTKPLYSRAVEYELKKRLFNIEEYVKKMNQNNPNKMPPWMFNEGV